MSIVDTVNQLLSSLTVIGNAIIIILLLNLLYKAKTRKHLPFVKGLWDVIKENALFYAFVIALLAMGGSLFYSEIAVYNPCKLCWYQRILMYPLVIILGVAAMKKTKDVIKYVVPLALIGGLISAYHFYGQVSNLHLPCEANAAVPCGIKFTFHFGYITIPMMALTAFILILICMIALSMRKETKTKQTE